MEGGRSKERKGKRGEGWKRGKAHVGSLPLQGTLSDMIGQVLAATS